jgi:uncharacterized membrane protein YphA (DoxX/SURF4 family)
MKAVQPETQAHQDPAKGLAIVRIAFGVVWLIDAVFKFEPAFYHGILGVVKAADAGEPGWLNPWFHAWYSLIGNAAGLFAVGIIIIESLIALSLLSGIARRTTYIGGAIFSFLIWSVAEGFGGPYVAGSTDIGAGIIYVLLFGLLYVVDTAKVPAYSLVPALAKLHRPTSPVLLKDDRPKARAEI